MDECEELKEKCSGQASSKVGRVYYLQRIDRWEKETVEKVHKAARRYRQEIEGFIDSKSGTIQRDLTKFELEISNLLKSGKHLQHDLDRLGEQLTCLDKNMNQLVDSTVLDINTLQSDAIVWHELIKVSMKPSFKPKPKPLCKYELFYDLERSDQNELHCIINFFLRLFRFVDSSDGLQFVSICAGDR